ncbi:MAG: hypothetical protein EB121_02855, partial [Alphaproteobacteria bacterium]|nr:hypothetical protein [Alphaproteobacteria bacterium]
MHDTHKLSKILARLDSPHEGEVTVAIRLAQGMLAKQNLSLTDVLASGLRQMGGKTSPKTNPPTVHMHAETTAVSLRHITALQQRLMALEENYKALEQIATSQEHEIKQWRERDRQWKSAQTLYQQQIDHWKKLAEDVTEKLWAIGRQLVPLQKRISERGFNEQALWRAGEAGATLGPPQGQAR